LRRRKTSERKSQAHGVIIFGAIYLRLIVSFMTRPSTLKLTIILFNNRIGYKQLEIKFIFNKDQVVDGFTKVLPIKLLVMFRRNLKVLRLSRGVRVVICIAVGVFLALFNMHLNRHGGVVTVASKIDMCGRKHTSASSDLLTMPSLAYNCI
jgi:hypothetical protein